MKVMTIYAHPADTITNCGGTLARHVDAGDEVTALILTHGGRIHANKYAEEWRKDHPDPGVSGADLSEIVASKEEELRRAAAIIGIETVVTLGLDDTMVTVEAPVVEQVASHLAEQRPDVVICDYPLHPAMTANTHTAATMTALAAMGRAGTYLHNLDGRGEFAVKQVFFTSLPVFPHDGLSTYGVRNDVLVDITPVVSRKVAAMDCFTSQGYHGAFARKLIEANNGEFGRAAGVNFAEAFYRLYNETHPTLPVTDAARAADPLTRHLSYSTLDLRAEHPVTDPSAAGSAGR
jgi:LmbE family N-acetylglucosaminyl deacetylase